MGTYIPPGACKAELQAAKDAVKDAKKTYRDFVAAKANVEAGMFGSGAGVLAIIGCGIGGVTGVGLVICLAGGGATVVSGGLWTAGGVPGLADAKDALLDAMDKADAAVDALCDCINSNTTSVPD